MNGLVVLAACLCAASAQVLVGPAGALINPVPSTQFHAQDEFGQFSFGHAGGPSARTESRDAFGVTTGSYQYIDANGLLQTVNYIADPINGFRVAATNLPQQVAAAPLAGPVFDLTGPAPVQDTPEVAAAKAEFQAAFDAAVAADAAAPAERRRRDADEVVATALPYPYPAAALPLGGVYAAAPAQIVANIAPATPALTYAAAPALAYANAPVVAAPALAYANSPVVAAAPAVAYAAGAVPAPAREATLTTIKLNPGHAVAYRVD